MVPSGRDCLTLDERGRDVSVSPDKMEGCTMLGSEEPREASEVLESRLFAGWGEEKTKRKTYVGGSRKC